MGFINTQGMEQKNIPPQDGALPPITDYTGSPPFKRLCLVGGRPITVTRGGTVFVRDLRGKYERAGSRPILRVTDERGRVKEDPLESEVGMFGLTEEQVRRAHEADAEALRDKGVIPSDLAFTNSGSKDIDLIDIGEGVKVSYEHYKELSKECTFSPKYKIRGITLDAESYVTLTEERINHYTTPRTRHYRVVDLVVCAYFPGCTLKPEANFVVSRKKEAPVDSCHVEDLIVYLKDYTGDMPWDNNPLLTDKMSRGGWIRRFKPRRGWVVKDPRNPRMCYPMIFDHPNFAMIDLAKVFAEAQLPIPLDFSRISKQVYENEMRLISDSEEFIDLPPDPGLLPG